MAYKVIFKGDMEPIYLGAVEGKTLMDDLERGIVKGMINLKGNLISVGSVKAVVPNTSDPDSQDKKSEFTEMVYKENKNFKEWRAKRLTMTPKNRAQSTSFMNYLSQALRGRSLTDNEIVEVRQKQERFFETHPDFHSANPTCYFSKKDLLLEDDFLPMVTFKNLQKKNALQFAALHLDAS